MGKVKPIPRKSIPAPKKATVWRCLRSRDTLFATILVFLVMATFVKLEDSLGLFDPKDMTAKDFDYNDLAFNLLSKYRNVPVDTDIYLVNIGNMDRKQIAGVIKDVNQAQPKVIGVDVLFDHHVNPEQDTDLSVIFATNKRIVAGYRLDPDQPFAGNIFIVDSGKKGYVNFTAGFQNVIRQADPYIVQKKDTALSFSAAIVKAFNAKKFDTLIARRNATETINYSGNNAQFIVIDATQKKADFSKVAGKIVLVGTIDTGVDIEDKHFTPLNSTIAGKSLPDLSGLVIQANIMRMMLENKYIDHWNKYVNWLFAFVLCWVHMAFFISYFIEKHIWFHLAAKLAQFVSSVIFIYLGLFLFYDFRLQIDLSSALVGIILAVDVLYFYEAGVVWLHHKKGYKTLFHHEYPN